MSDDRENRGTSGEREGFASRWARRKREAGREPPEKATAAPVVAEDTRSDEEILRELDLPPPESLKPGDDFSPFMGAGVPARLRNRALRRLWGSKPALANLDGLVDYGEDFTNAATVPALFKTAYKVGRGWMDDEDQTKPEETKPEPAPAEPEAEASEIPPGTPPETPPETLPNPGTAPSAAPEGTLADSSESAAAIERPERHTDAESETALAAPRPTPRRRMRFRFTDG